MARKIVSLGFPIGGLNRRHAFQSPFYTKRAYTSPNCQNVFPDDPILGRERGGSRPGIGKAYAQELGSGAKIYGLATVEFQLSGARAARLMAIANGTLYRESTVDTTMTAVSSSLTLASDRLIHMVDHLQTLYIGDNGPILHEYTDGAISSNDQFTSASAGSFSGVNSNDYMLVITAGGAGANETQTLTMTGTPTGGTFTLSFDYDGVLYTTAPIPYNATSTQVQTRLRDELGSASVTCAGGAFPGSAITVTFAGNGLAALDVPLLSADPSNLTGGTLVNVTVAETTKGGGADLGAYTIALSGSTITLGTETQDATGISFYITRAPKKYNPVSFAITKLTADADKGFVPLACPIMVRWRDRLVFGGGTKSPNNIFASRQGDAEDWDYAVVDDPGAAWALSTGEAGQLGEEITCLIPHSDDCLLIGCTTSFWILRGDPSFGGRLDRLSPEIGVVGPNAYCYTPEGVLYFMSRDGLYAMPPGCGATPQSVSREKLPEELLNIASTATVSMAYSLKERAIYLSISSSSAGSSTHYWLDVKQTDNSDSGFGAAFFPMTYQTAHDPFTLHAIRDRTSAYSTVMLGCRDGYLRVFKNDLEQDDGSNAITSFVEFGPIDLAGDGFSDGMLHEIHVTLAANSGSVACAARTADSAEQAFNATALFTHTFSTAGRNATTRPRLSGTAAVIRLTNGASNDEWALEALTLVTEKGGRLRL